MTNISVLLRPLQYRLLSLSLSARFQYLSQRFYHQALFAAVDLGGEFRILGFCHRLCCCTSPRTRGLLSKRSAHKARWPRGHIGLKAAGSVRKRMWRYFLPSNGSSLWQPDPRNWSSAAANVTREWHSGANEWMNCQLVPCTNKIHALAPTQNNGQLRSF